MRNRILLLSIVCFSIGFTQAQTTEELTVLKEAKATELTSVDHPLMGTLPPARADGNDHDARNRHTERPLPEERAGAQPFSALAGAADHGARLRTDP